MVIDFNAVILDIFDINIPSFIFNILTSNLYPRSAITFTIRLIVEKIVSYHFSSGLTFKLWIMNYVVFMHDKPFYL